MKEHIRLRQDAARQAGSGFPEYLMGQLPDAPLKPVGSPLGLRVTSDFTLQFSLQFTNLQANRGLRRQVDGQQARRALQWPTDTIKGRCVYSGSRSGGKEQALWENCLAK